MKQKSTLLKSVLCTVLLCAILVSCTEKTPSDDYRPVLLTTNAITAITATTAVSGAVITDSSNSPITLKGICWSTTPAPVFSASTKTVVGAGGASFTGTLTGLSPNTVYYVRAFALNDAGANYGNELSFTTAAAAVTGTVTIGSQVWAQKNLDVSTYRNGDPIPQVSDKATWSTTTTGAWCYYDNNPANEAIYGKLYNWYAVNDPRGLAPAGFHIPSDAEWTTLTSFLGGEALVAGKMRANSTLWTPPNIAPPDNNNSSGFTGLPAGYFSPLGDSYYGIHITGYWWSATASDNANAYMRAIDNYYPQVYRVAYPVRYGLSVRVIKD